jgi:hypothetical protein
MQMWEVGFYWVKSAAVPEVGQIGVWQIGFFNGEGWELGGQEGPCYDEYVAEVAEKINCPYQPELGDT